MTKDCPRIFLSTYLGNTNTSSAATAATAITTITTTTTITATITATTTAAATATTIGATDSLKQINNIHRTIKKTEKYGWCKNASKDTCSRNGLFSCKDRTRIRTLIKYDDWQVSYNGIGSKKKHDCH